MNPFASISTFLLLLLLLLESTLAEEVAPERKSRRRRELVNNKPLVGGYQPAKLDDRMIQEAATFALHAVQDESSVPYSFGSQAINVEIIDARQQVVQGLNFQLTLMFTGDNEECVGAASVLVYNKFGVLSITNWTKEITCEDAKEMMRMVKVSKINSGD